MMEQPIKITRYGIEVWETPTMDSVRRENCMCHHCGRFNPGDYEENCGIANSFFRICQTYGTAFILTRCAEWEPITEKLGADRV